MLVYTHDWICVVTSSMVEATSWLARLCVSIATFGVRGGKQPGTGCTTPCCPLLALLFRLALSCRAVLWDVGWTSNTTRVLFLAVHTAHAPALPVAVADTPT